MPTFGGWGQLLYLIPRGSCNIFDVLVQWSSIPRFAPNAPCCWYGANIMWPAVGVAPVALCSSLRWSLTTTAVTDISYVCMGDELTLINRRALVNRYGVFKRLKNWFVLPVPSGNDNHRSDVGWTLVSLDEDKVPGLCCASILSWWGLVLWYNVNFYFQARRSLNSPKQQFLVTQLSHSIAMARMVVKQALGLSNFKLG